MGDFDKHQAGSTPNAANEKKKLAMVGLLGAVLLGVVCFHFMKGTPQAAMASESDGIAAPTASGQTPEEALATLDPSRDPTAHLLEKNTSLPEDYLQVPRDPFLVSKAWRALLEKPAETVKPLAAKPETVVVPPTPQAPAIPADTMKVSGILTQGTKVQAIINGVLVSTGMNVGNATVVEITSDHVVVRHKDWPGGPRTTIDIQGK